MSVARFRSWDSLPDPDGPLHLAIGMFDGVHLGHQAVIETAVHSARRRNGRAAVLTFHPHPSRIFRPDDPVPLIMSPDTKARVLEQLGVDWVIEQPFTAEYAKLSADEFVDALHRAAPRLEGVYVGENWRFGRGREGDVARLIKLGRERGFGVISAQRLNVDGEPISSTRVRRLLREGEIATANALLGYSYFVSGPVVPGRRLGATIGFPTLNISWMPDLTPRYGVYVTRVRREGEAASEALPAVANYGVRPTVNAPPEAPILEAHILESCQWGPGDRLFVEWLDFLRPERQFSSVEELRTQIARDRDAAVEWFREVGREVRRLEGGKVGKWESGKGGESLES